MTRRVVTGVPELEAAMRHLSDKAADRVAKAALGGGGSYLARQIRKFAPKRTGALRKSIRYRFIKGRGRQRVTAKVGVNVGKQKKDENGNFVSRSAPHAHLVALGTVQRTRKTIGGKFAYIRHPTERQLNTGSVRPQDFVKAGTAAATAGIIQAMKKRAIKALEREAKKARAAR